MTNGTGAPAARVANLTKTYGTGQALVRALDGVTLDLADGEFTAVMGPQRLRQVHAHALLRGARHRRQRLGATSVTTS